MKKSRIIYVLIGPPAVGKSTWIKKNIDPNNSFIISSDDITEKVADTLGWSYDDLFVSPPNDAKIGDVDEKYGEVIEAPKNMPWKKTIYSKVTKGREMITQEFKNSMSKAKSTEKNVIVDLTNMNLRDRKDVLNKVSNPEDYKIAVIFKFIGKENILKNIANKRAIDIQKIGKTKTISPQVIEKIIASYEPPTPQEGYDKIIYSDTISSIKKNLEITEIKKIIRTSINHILNEFN